MVQKTVNDKNTSKWVSNTWPILIFYKKMTWPFMSPKLSKKKKFFFIVCLKRELGMSDDMFQS